MIFFDLQYGLENRKNAVSLTAFFFFRSDSIVMSPQQQWFQRNQWEDDFPAREDRAVTETMLACFELSEKFASSSTKQSLESYLEELLGHIQGNWGCQGIGLFGKSSQWKPIAKLGGRSLGKPNASWLDKAAMQNTGGYIADVPASGWGQIICPLNATIDGVSFQVLVLSGRHLCEKDFDSVSLLAVFLEKMWSLLDVSLGWQEKSVLLVQLCNDFTKFLTAKSVEELLTLLAAQSVSLLKCERATIFIRDVRNKQLIGSPAIGLQENSLVIPEEAGVVGQVIQTGLPVIVEEVATDSHFQNSIDEKTGFQTRNILCVPLFDAKKNLIGAFECLNKTSGLFEDRDQFLLELLAHHAAILIQQVQVEQKIQRQQSELQTEKCSQCDLIGESAAMNAIRFSVDQLGSNDLPVLITGETGTGKEMIASAIHYQGNRSEKPFVVVPCAELAEENQEAELFGAIHFDKTKGSDDDAKTTRRRGGKIEQADRGTLVLNEISCLSIETQEKIFQFLETGIITPVGSSQELRVAVRVIATSTFRLTEKILEGKFQEELYHRLAIASINLPALRERLDDIEPLMQRFLGEFCKQVSRPVLRCSSEVIEQLKQYQWVGNVKELKNIAERLAYVVQGAEILMEDVARICGMETGSVVDQSSLGLTEATLDFQQRFIRQKIAAANGNMTTAARLLGLHRSNLYRKMDQLKMTEAKEEPSKESNESLD